MTEFKMYNLSEVCRVYQPETISKKSLPANGTYPVYGANGKIGLNDKFNHEEPQLLLGCRGSVGSIHISEPFSWINGNAMVVKPFEDLVTRDYLKYALLGGIKIVDAISGTAQPQITRESLSRIKIPVPTLEIQGEIIGKLDSVFAEIRKMKLNILEQLEANSSLLSQAIRNLINDPNVECRITTLDTICENLDNKRIPITRDVRASGEYPYYGASGIIDYVEDYIFEGDALLVSEDGANLLARSTPIAFSVSGKYWVNNHAHILKFNDQELQKYIEYLLENTKLDDFITGAAQPKLTQRALNTIPIRIPVQESDVKQVVAVISSLKEFSSSVSENLKLRLKLTDELQASILGKYFTVEEAVA
jgi:type I restriction enzyme S subunit